MNNKNHRKTVLAWSYFTDHTAWCPNCKKAWNPEHTQLDAGKLCASGELLWEKWRELKGGKEDGRF